MANDKPAGKGSKQRPRKIDYSEYEQNWDRIFNGKAKQLHRDNDRPSKRLS